MIDPRKVIRKFREENGFTHRQAADYCGISEVLYKILENGGTTHPNIAAKIGSILGLSELQIEDLMPEHRRPHSPKYEPDKYVEHTPDFHLKKTGPITWIEKEV